MSTLAQYKIMSFKSVESESHMLNRETSDIYAENISCNDKVVVVGPSTSINNDATLLLVSHILAGQGELFVVDPQASSDKMDWKRISERADGYVTGAGAIDRHLEELQVLRKVGMHLTTPNWLGEKSSAQRIRLPDFSCDVLADHNTALFIAGLKDGNEERRWERAFDVFKEYARILKSGGTLLFQTSPEYNLEDGNSNLEALLRSVGITSTRQTVDDNVRIHIPIDIYIKITSQNESLPKCKANPYLYDYLKTIIQEKDGEYYLLFNKPQRSSDDSIQYWCPDFYVGKKI